MLCGFGASLWLVVGALANGSSSPDYNYLAGVLAAAGISISTAAVSAAIGAAIGSIKKKYKTVYLNPTVGK